MLGPAYFDRPSDAVARDLIGARLLVEGVGGMIVEVEAYAPDDPASHSFNGPTPRNAAMFGPPARAYVYRSYGIHWCLNFVCSEASAVLIRAMQPQIGLDVMAERRGVANPRLLCAGPGRLCQALGVTREHDRLLLDQPPFAVYAAEGDPAVAVGPRIGISKAVDVPWRFGLQGSRYLSRPFR
jgi:DNA-3-methyladenine glycosylase